MSDERIVFDAKTVSFGFLVKKYITINSIIMLFKRHISANPENEKRNCT